MAQRRHTETGHRENDEKGKKMGVFHKQGTRAVAQTEERRGFGEALTDHSPLSSPRQSLKVSKKGENSFL